MKARKYAVTVLRGLMLAVAVSLAPAAPLWADLPKASVLPPTTSQRVTATMMGMPLQFEANHGQVDAQVKFLARGIGYTLFLTPTESVMVLQQQDTTTENDGRTVTDPSALPKQAPITQAVVRMKLEGANPSPAVDGMEQLPGIVNYFIGNDPEKWRANIPTYAKVQYQDAYPGIALAYYGNQGRLEYDFLVAPGADPNQIKLAFEGASDITVADSGDLVLTTALGEVLMQKPIVYQLEPDGHKTLVAGHYVVRPTSVSLHASRTTNHEVEIQLASYDHTKPVVIDPVLLYSTYLGGFNNEEGYSIAVDAVGQAYVTGYTYSTDFPTVSPIQAFGGVSDAFVTKLSAAGSLLYSTYLGGNNSDRGINIAVDAAGHAYVTGETFSRNFPLVSPYQATFGGVTDVFVTKLSAAGSLLLYSTYLGGTGNDNGSGIAVDAAGQAYVTGVTASRDFPTVNPVQAFGGVRDAFVTKLSAAGSLLYSTYLGGNTIEEGSGIAVDTAGQAYVTGETYSRDFPTVSPYQATFGGGLSDAFVTKLSAAGSLLYSTYLGGNNSDSGSGIAMDAAGQAYVTGVTASRDFPTVSPVQAFGGAYDAFVTKLSAAGSLLLYSTYLGGTGNDNGSRIAVDAAGQAYVTGVTASTDFPTVSPVQAFGGVSDAFVTKLSAAGSLLFSTYLGGSVGDVGYGIAVDAAGQAYVTGHTNSTDFPTVSPVQAFGGAYDAFVTKLGEKPIANAGLDQAVDEGSTVTLDGSASTGTSLSYAWTHVAGPSVVLAGANTVSPSFTAPLVPVSGATVTLQLIVTNNAGISSDPDTVNIHVINVNHPPVADAGPDLTVQGRSSVQLDGTASYDPDGELLTFQWTQLLGPSVTFLGGNTAMPTFAAPTVGSAGATLVFDLTVADPHTLTGSDSVSIDVTNMNQIATANAGPNQTVNENTLVTLNGMSSKARGHRTLNFTWTQTAGPPVTLTGGTTANPTFTAPAVVSGGTTLTFQLVVSDGQTSSAPDSVNIHVQDTNDPPACTLAQPSVTSLWPPDHSMVPVSILGVTDPNNQAITITYSTVTQDEPVNGLGDGDTSPDAAVSGNQVLLRAERAVTGNGRVYVVHFTATDDNGSCNGSVTVGVPIAKNGTAGEGSQLYNSFAP